MTGEAERITIDTPMAFRAELPEAVDVAVIGGGVVGVFSALYMARRGLRVLLCEKGRVAGEQSSRNWGWIRQQGRDPAELPIMTEALGLWHAVNRETNGACGVRTCGSTYLASTEASLESDRAWLGTAEDAGLDTRVLSRAETAALFDGAAGERWIGALHTPSDACGEPWQAVPAVARLAEREGVAIREGCAVRALDIAGGRIAGIVTEDGPVACEQVVLAAGAWSSLLARRHGIRMPQLTVRSTVGRTNALPEVFSGCAADEELAIRRRRDGGYSLALCDVHEAYAGPDALSHMRAYLPQLALIWRTLRPGLAAPTGFPDAWGTPRRWAEDAPSPFERMRVLEAPPSHRQAGRMAERFAARFPGLGRPEIRTLWAGMIDTMPDVVPVVDRVADCQGLIVATGMSGHGFGIGPGFGDVVARIAAGATQKHDISRFRFSRFTDGSELVLGPSL